MKKQLQFLHDSIAKKKKLLSILLDPDKLDLKDAERMVQKAEKLADFLLIGGSTDEYFKTEKAVKAIKQYTKLPLLLFPGDYTQLTDQVDAVLFLSLLSGRNPEYLIEQQIKAVPFFQNKKMEAIPTAYILVEGGKESAVQRVSGTKPISQSEVFKIVATAVAGQLMGKQLVYLEAGSGAEFPVNLEIISEVKKSVDIPLIVGGGIRTQEQLRLAYEAGADIVIVGTAFENGIF